MNKVIKNISWIVVCKIIQAILSLLVSMLTARYLGPSNFGLVNYAASIVSFFVPLMQLGLRSTLVNEFIENPDDEGEILGSTLIMTSCSAIICMAGAVAFVLIANNNESTTILVCALYSISLLCQAIEMIQYWFQAKLLSKYTALVSLSSYVIVSLYKIYLLVTEKSVYWFALAQSIDYIVIAVLLFLTYKRLGGNRITLSFDRCKRMLQRSKPYIISGMMVNLYIQTDRLMIKNMIGDTDTGYYSAAVTCASMSSFVFAAIIDSMRPVILENKKQGSNEYSMNLMRLFSVVFYLSLVQCSVMTAFAKPIVNILYGDAYSASAGILCVVVWYVTYSYFGTIRNIWILAEGKQKHLWKINSFGAISNVVLNFVLIPVGGVYGAAVASVVTQFLTNFLLGFIIEPIRNCNKLMLKSLDPKFAFSEFKSLIILISKHFKCFFNN